MGSIPKSQKLCKEHNDKHGEDRISNLPSSLIGDILSLLPTKDAVATSVLSTQWRQFWKLTTSLDFNDGLLPHPRNSSIQTRFTSFVYRVLLLRRGSCLRKFRLNCYQGRDVSHVSTWVAASLACGVQELDLSIRKEESPDLVLPRELFSCSTLVVLKLGTDFVINVPTLVRMTSLKILHLHRVILVDNDSVNRLLLGCPVLEELSMRECIGKDVHIIHIFAPALIKLFINSLPYYENLDTEVYKYKIVLDTPALQYLELVDDIESVEGCLIKNLCHLIKADIDIGNPFNMQYSHKNASKAVTDLLMGISEVQFLHLHGDFMEVLFECHCRLPMFLNLTSLELARAFCDVGWDLMLRLLEKSPRLETLVFSDEDDGSKPWHWNPPENVPTCLLFHLKVIQILGFEGDKEELKMVEYFLKNAGVLEKFIIHSQCPVVEKLGISKKLLMFPRRSKICSVEHLLT